MSSKVSKVLTAPGAWVEDVLLKPAGELFTGPDIEQPKKPGAATAEDEEVRAAAERQAVALRKRRGRASTIVTGPTGLSDQPVTRKTTLG